VTSRSPDQVVALLRGHLSGLDLATVQPLGAGLDNTAYLVGDGLVARFRRDPQDYPAVAREAALLGLVAGVCPVPVPPVRAVLPEAGCLVTDLLRGWPLLGRLADLPPGDAERLGGLLGRLIGALAAVPPAEVAAAVDADETSPAEWLAEARETWAEVAAGVPTACRTSVERFLDAEPPPPEQRNVLCHNDLGAEHVLVDDRLQVTGVLDWSDAALTDPARDLGLIRRDLGPEALEAALPGLLATGDWDADAVRRRALFLARCALLEDLAHGLGDGPRAYADKSLAALPELFAAQP